MTHATNASDLRDLPRDTTLAGRTALVTGASSGIGEAIAHVLAASGAHVLITGRDEARTSAVADAITEAGGPATPLIADLAAPAAAIRDLAARASEAAAAPAEPTAPDAPSDPASAAAPRPGIDILVNNAGIYPGGPTELLADEDLDALLATNIRAPHTLVAALAPAMAERGTGSIVNIGSWMARVGVPFMALYPATKAAVEQLTRAWAAEYGPRGVRVNTVAPGATATPGNADAAEVLAAMTQGTPAGEPVRPVDIARAVRWLVSDEAAFVHGATLDVDGGIASTRLR